LGDFREFGDFRDLGDFRDFGDLGDFRYFSKKLLQNVSVRNTEIEPPSKRVFEKSPDLYHRNIFERMKSRLFIRSP